MQDSFVNGITENPSPEGLLQSYNAASSQLTGSASDALKQQCGYVRADSADVTWDADCWLHGGRAIDFASKVSSKISSGSLTAGDLMGFTTIGLKAIGDVAMAALKLLDTPLMGGGEDTQHPARPQAR